MLPAQTQNMPPKSNYENHGKLCRASSIELYGGIPLGDTTISYELDKYGNMLWMVTKR